MTWEPEGFIIDGKIYLYRDGIPVPVERATGTFPNGWTWEIGPISEIGEEDDG